jgi:hypothetical protein
MPTTSTSETHATTTTTNPIWPTTAKAIATLQTAKLIERTDDLMLTKLAILIYKQANTINARMKQDAVEKMKKEMKALAKFVFHMGNNDDL